MYIRIRLWEGITLCPTIFSNEIIQWHSKNHYSATNRKIWHYSKNPRIPVFLFTFYYLHAKFEKKFFLDGADFENFVSVCPGITLWKSATVYPAACGKVL